MDAVAVATWGLAGATVLGASAVLYAANIGAASVKTWLGQKRAERQVEAAERILALGYRLRRDFEAIRSPAQFAGEIERAEKMLVADNDAFRLMDGQRRRDMTTAQVYITRLSDLSQRWEELFSLVPVAKAYFGDEVEAALVSFWIQRGQVHTAAMMIGDGQLDLEFRRQMEADIWEGVYQARGQEDPINAAIGRSIDTLAYHLLPVLRGIPS